MKIKEVLEEAIALEPYESFGNDYARVIENNAYNAHFERPSTLALMPEVWGQNVLDAGCGPGAYVPWLLEHGASVVGIDVSPAMLEIAKSKFSGKAQFHLHDLSNPMTMLASETFDIILSSLMIHYVRDLEKLFSEFRRVLKNQGKIIFSTHHPFLDMGASVTKNYFQRELLAQDWYTVGRPVKVRFYRRPLSEITKAISANGFVIEEMNEGVLTDSLRQVSPEIFDNLSKNPQFLFFKLRK
jgi:SAM-dependent methyltransferase